MKAVVNGAMSQLSNLFTGFVLAGGESRRMGRPKALLVLGGETMLKRQIRLLQTMARKVYVVGSPPDVHSALMRDALRGVRCWPDRLPGRGPLAGIYTGLKRTRTEYNLFLSCDIPFVNAGLLQYLCRRAIESQADVTIPKSKERRMNPLCAVYRRRALGAIRECLESGENKISGFFPRVRCEVLAWKEIARAGFASSIFANINTPEEYQAAKRQLRDESLH